MTTRLAPRLWLCLAVWPAALLCAADDPATPSPGDKPAPLETPAATAPTIGQEQRPVVEVSYGGDSRTSARLKSTLMAGLPSYQPPPPPKPVDESASDEEGEEDERTTDRPRNGIIRLPRMVIDGGKSPILRERDLYSRKNLADVAVNRYLSELDRGVLNRFTLPLLGMSNQARAMMMYEEDERLRNMSNLNDTANMVEKVDPTAAADLRDQTNDLYMRRTDYGPITDKP